MSAPILDSALCVSATSFLTAQMPTALLEKNRGARRSAVSTACWVHLGANERTVVESRSRKTPFKMSHLISSRTDTARMLVKRVRRPSHKVTYPVDLMDVLLPACKVV